MKFHVTSRTLETATTTTTTTTTTAAAAAAAVAVAAAAAAAAVPLQSVCGHHTLRHYNTAIVYLPLVLTPYTQAPSHSHCLSTVGTDTIHSGTITQPLSVYHQY